MSLEQVLEQLVELLADRVVERAAEKIAAAVKVEQPAAMITMSEFAERNGISIGLVRKMISDGRLQAVKLGRAVRIASDATIGKPTRPAPAKPSEIVTRLPRRRP